MEQHQAQFLVTGHPRGKMQQGQVEICETLRYSISVFFALSDYIFFLLRPRDGKASLHFVVWVCIFSGHLSFWLRTRWPHASNMSCRILRYLFRIVVVVVVNYNSKVQESFFLIKNSFWSIPLYLALFKIWLFSTLSLLFLKFVALTSSSSNVFLLTWLCSCCFVLPLEYLLQS